MNASFRTAFWAMCLGLTVPMMLFVGVELSSGGRAGAAGQVVTAKGDSLRARWAKTAGRSPAVADRRAANPKAKRKPDSARRARDEKALATGSPHAATEATEPGTAGSVGSDVVHSEETAGDDAGGEPRVTLSPELEADPTAPDEGPAGRGRVPAIPTKARPRVELVPEALTPGRGQTETRIEQQLDQILEHLDQLVHKVGDRRPAADPMQQATELLGALQQARKMQELAAQVAPPDTAPAETKPAPSSGPQETPHDEPATPARPRETEAPALLPEPDKVPVEAGLLSKIYRPRYVSVRALEALAQPLLTPGLGRIASAEARDTSAAAESLSSSPTQWEAIVVRDTPEVLRKIDRLARELDIPPQRILLETSLLTIRLDASMPFGVDLAAYNGAGQSFAVTPADLGQGGAAPSLWGSSAGVPALRHGAGVKSGVVRGDPRALLQVMQATNRVQAMSAAQHAVINKHSVVLKLPGGPSTGDTGCDERALHVRPIVARDGAIHLELGSGNSQEAQGHELTLRAGESAVLAGFHAEQLVTHWYRTPGMGELPLVGRYFRSQTGVTERLETIVLITPHVVAPELTAPPALSRGAPPRNVTPRDVPPDVAAAADVSADAPAGAVEPAALTTSAAPRPTIKRTTTRKVVRRPKHAAPTAGRAMIGRIPAPRAPAGDAIPEFPVPAEASPRPEIHPFER